jgi:hypothetical protein
LYWFKNTESHETGWWTLVDPSPNISVWNGCATGDLRLKSFAIAAASIKHLFFATTSANTSFILNMDSLTTNFYQLSLGNAAAPSPGSVPPTSSPFYLRPWDGPADMVIDQCWHGFYSGEDPMAVDLVWYGWYPGEDAMDMDTTW